MKKKLTNEELQKAQDTRLKLYNDMKAFNDANASAWTAEAQTQWESMEKDYDAAVAAIDEHNEAVKDEQASAAGAAARRDRLDRMNNDGTRFRNSGELLFGGDGDFSGGRMQNRSARPLPANLRNYTVDQVHQMAFNGWLSGVSNSEVNAALAYVGLSRDVREITCDFDETRGFRNIQAAVVSRDLSRIQNAQSDYTGAAGGFLHGVSFVSQLEVAMTAASGMMEVAEVITTDGAEEMRWPTVDDTSNEGRQLGESKAVTVTDLAFGQARWYAHKFSSDMIKVPYELLINNAVGLENYIPSLCGERIGRIINRKATVGDGAGTMNGIVTAASSGVTAASSSAITWDEVINLEHSVNRAIRANRAGCGYMFNDSTLKLLRKLKDSQNRYLWQAGANTGAPDTMNTYRYTINDHMADVASAAKTMLFGRLSSYKIRMVRRVRFRRLEERYADNDQVAFIMFVQADGNLLNPGDNPVKYLVQA